MIQQVLTMAAALGKTEPDEALEALCTAAVEELTGQLRPGVTPEECGGAFVLAAAWIALGDRETGGGFERFTAGEVTIQKGDARLRREALRLQARQVMRPWLVDGGFTFKGVRG